MYDVWLLGGRCGLLVWAATMKSVKVWASTGRRRPHWYSSGQQSLRPTLLHVNLIGIILIECSDTFSMRVLSVCIDLMNNHLIMTPCLPPENNSDFLFNREDRLQLCGYGRVLKDET